MDKYRVEHYNISSLLSWVMSDEIAIPEIQRPFVWSANKVRDLIDSLYQGYPIGYITTWKNPNIRLKNGAMSEGKKILIDGQQRITALTAAILGHEVINKHYAPVHIRIAFHPPTERFEVQNKAILNDKTWIPDISAVIQGNIFDIFQQYRERNRDIDDKQIQQVLSQLIDITKKPVGLIELSATLDIETVTEIFIRINSQGVQLNQANFVISKIAADTQNGGNQLLKTIDYFCHFATEPSDYPHIKKNDSKFAETEAFKSIEWRAQENDNLYTPNYTDLLRVAFTSQFNRGKLADLVSLLSGRNFAERTFEASIAEDTFTRLKVGCAAFVNETNFKRFLMILRSAGFIDPSQIRSKSAINFAYILYLTLKAKQVNAADIETYVKRWFVYSILTGRYSSSPESTFDYDIKRINNKPFAQLLAEHEAADLSDAYWRVSLPQSLDTASVSSPYLQVYLAALIKNDRAGFLSTDIKVRELLTHKGDQHHLFPKDYLIKNGYKNRNEYNQIANYALTQSEINIKIGNKAPHEYFDLIQQQMTAPHDKTICGIKDQPTLHQNLAAHDIPDTIITMSASDYPDFLVARRERMAATMRDHYFSL